MPKIHIKNISANRYPLRNNHSVRLLFRNIPLLLVILTVIFSPAIFAEAPVPLDSFKKMIILENGRKKPMDTYARNTLILLSGRSSYGKMPAIQWLARVVFDPQTAFDDKVFLVNHPDIPAAINLAASGKARDRYSYNQLKPCLEKLQEQAMSFYRKKEETRLPVENEIILLYNKIYVFQQLTQSLLFSLPEKSIEIPDPVAKAELGLDTTKNTFTVYQIIASGAVSKILAIENQLKTKDPAHWTPLEKNLKKVSVEMNRLVEFSFNLPFTVFPLTVKPVEKWGNPWEALTMSAQHNRFKKELDFLDKAVTAYRSGDADGFNIALQSFNRSIMAGLNGTVTPGNVSLEVFYNNCDPFFRAQLFYGVALLLLLLSSLFWKKWLYRFSFILLIIGFIPHTAGIIMRMIIRSRPPVTNLYETFIFAAWMTVLLGLLLEFFKKKKIGILTGAFSGVALLLIAGKYAMKGDTMGMLVAVLDSNFWLATHVITITVGYAGIVISGVIGHMYLLQRIFKPRNKELLKNTFQAIYATQAFGLIFTFTGTVLGGIWADQSWGRFWGWDPKENGALLIILWSAMLFHARLAKMIKESGFALGSIAGNICIALAWFGVNLLGVGLHSYGFTSGIARALFIFCAVELVFIMLAYMFLPKNKDAMQLNDVPK